MLYILIDEFEDVSKLSKSKFLDYLLVLNALINAQRRWAIAISLTEDALDRIKEESAPLYDRLSTWIINIPPLNDTKAKELIEHYLSLARDNNLKDKLFSDKIINEMVKRSEGNYRSFIKLCHKLVEFARSNSKNLLDLDDLNKVDVNDNH
jgi:hypothetical protein